MLPKPRIAPVALLLIATAFSLAACAAEPTPPAPGHEARPAARAPAALPRLLVHKSPTCGCCTKWVDHLRANGFQVEVVETSDLPAVQARVGVPAGKGSCHTAEVGGYFIEGHVPAADIRRLLAEHPEARGLTVPGMPLGSPGMEAPGGRKQPFDTLLVLRSGQTRVFARHNRA